jgi:signal transduction histidine kinase
VQGKIMVVLKTTTYQKEIVDTLQAEGYEVILATRAIEALDLAREYQPNLIVTELLLNDMSGRELTANLRSESAFSTIPIILILPKDKRHEKEISFAAGVSGFIDEPINLKALPLQVQFFKSGGSVSQETPTNVQDARERYLHEVVKQLETRLRELEMKNEQLLRLDDIKDTFIQLISHELRTPFTLISGYSHLLQDYLMFKSNNHDADYLLLMSGLTESIDRMQSVIEETLTVSRIMTRQIEIAHKECNLREIMRQVVEMYRVDCKARKLKVHFKADDFNVLLQADEELLVRLFANLFSNAIKYTPDGREIFFRAEPLEKVIRCHIKDTGIGIATDRLDKIFDRMSYHHNVNMHTTSKTSYLGGGLGLGLSICHGIVEAHEGRIWAQSEGFDVKRLCGSEFTVELPRIPDSNIPLASIKRPLNTETQS